MTTNGVRKGSMDSQAGILSGGALKEIVKVENKKFTLKIKKAAPKPTEAGNWKESEAKNADGRPSAAGSPVVNPLDEKTLAGFQTGRPLDDKVDTIQCKHCRRPILRAASATHIRDCLNKKADKQRKKKEAKEAKDAALRKEKGEDDDDIRARKSAIKGLEPGAKKGKKRKLDGDSEKPGAKKKKKDEPKAKGAKPKGPVDVERQCGVPLPNGGFCARSLTCKSHSMGLKRAVPGRSLPYDMLLAQYQKKNQAKQQRAAIDANAPLPEDLEPSGAVDSDEEKDAIMAALARHKPRPIASYSHMSQRNKYQYIRMSNMLRGALGNPPGLSAFGNPPSAVDGGNSNGNSNTNNGNGSTNNGAGMGLRLGIMGAPPSSATSENFPSSAGMSGFPMSAAGLDGSNSNSNSNSNGNMGMGMNMGRRQSGMMSSGVGAGGPRQILPGQLPGPGGQRKSSLSVGGS